MFADDIAMISHSWKDMDTLLEFSTSRISKILYSKYDFGSDMNSEFSPTISAVPKLSQYTKDQESTLYIQAREQVYENLVITSYEGKNYPERREKQSVVSHSVVSAPRKSALERQI